MKDKSDLLKIVAIINIIITALFGLYILIFDLHIFNHHNDSNISKCINKFNCSTCENGVASCSYFTGDGKIETGLKCPCNMEESK